jgi:molecular chaperone GrpE
MAMTEKELPSPAAPDESGAAAALQQERDELFDRLRRTMADFDNYRKRTDRERRELSDVITADVIRDVLPVLDDLERALAAQASSSDPQESAGSYRRGVELIHRQLVDALRKRGVEPIDVIGQPFDPMWQEAVAQEPAADGEKDGTVTAEIRRGYRIGQRLLRPAQVRVAKA